MDELNSSWIKVICNRQKAEKDGPEFLDCASAERVRRLYRGLDEYRSTPLIRLKGLAQELGVKEIFVKDESYRFGLNAFKGLGGMYALVRLICEKLGLNPDTICFQDLLEPQIRDRIRGMVFVSATDGNHGKGVAWAARYLGCTSYIFMPKGSTQVRAEAIRRAGASEVKILDVGYDDAVRYAAKLAEEQGWQLVQDTSWEGYEKIPEWIAQGYTVMAAEAADQLEAAGIKAPTHVFLQAGVGSMAGGVTGYLSNRYREEKPVFCVAEPEAIPCIFKSVEAGDGAPHTVEEEGQTIMAGLNCGEPCTVTWPVLRDQASWLFSCQDQVAALGMRVLAAPGNEDERVISGESGAVTAGVVTLLAKSPELRELRQSMKLDENAVILLFSTEGNTDPDRYRDIVYGGAYPLVEKLIEDAK